MTKTMKTRMFSGAAGTTALTVRRAATVLLMMLLTATTAWAQPQPKIYLHVQVEKIDNANGTVNITYTNSSGETVTENNIASDSEWTGVLHFDSEFTLTMTPADGCMVKEFQRSKGNVYIDLKEADGTTVNNGVYTFKGKATGVTYKTTFSPIGTYDLTGNISNAAGATMSFSVNGNAVSYAMEGQVVDVTLSRLCGYNEWSVASSDIEEGGITQDDANHFHFTMPANAVTLTATRNETAHSEPGYFITDNSTEGGHLTSGETYGTGYRPGETIKLTPVPDSYTVLLTNDYSYAYQPGSLSATNAATGEAIALTVNGDGTWSFTMPEANVDVSATFTLDESTYRVHFDRNGGDGTMDDQFMMVDRTTQLRYCNFKRYNYIFVGWASNASDDSYADGERVTNLVPGGQEVTLYALWLIKTPHVVHFEANGGSGTMDDQTFYKSQAQALTANAFTRDGYTFIGWNTEADGSGTRYSDSESITFPYDLIHNESSTTLYAQWVDDNHYAVHFDKNCIGNDNVISGTMTDQIFTVGVAQALSSNAFNRVGYSFSGWNTKANGSGDNYADGATVTNLAAGGQAVVLYAQWEVFQIQIAYAVHFDANGGEGTMADQIHPAGSYKLSANTFTRDGYSFTGWNTKADGSGTAYADQGYFSFGPDKTLYAQWTLTDDLYVNGDTYTINTATGWNLFCDALQDNDTYNRFSGKTVKLGNDIEVSRMAGSDYHDFCGTFDGRGHTITLDGNIDNGCYALFRNVSTDRANPNDTEDTPAAIRNLHVTGTITIASQNAAGLISGKWGNVTIENCRSSVTIKSSKSGDGTHGGLVAVNNNFRLDIIGCVFDGKLLTTGATATAHCGGFVGWNGGTLNISNSLYAPAAIENGETEVQAGSGDYPSATFARNGARITNSYYTRTLGTAQGLGYSLASAPVNIGTAGTRYSVSGITPYTRGLLCNGLYYMTPDAVSLADASSNNVAGINGYFADVTLTGRKLYKDGAWNTLCLPFDIALEGSYFEGATVKELGNSAGCKTGFDAKTGTLTLDFVDAYSINAGHAYIVKWTTTGDPIEDPVFHAVTIRNEDPTDQSANSRDGSVTFKGTYDAIPFTATDRSVLLLGSNNTLYYPQPDVTDPAHPVYPSVGAFRAYFQLNGIEAGDPANGVRAFVLNFGDGDEAQGITTTNYTNFTNSSGAWYTLNGVKLDKAPTRKGLYIMNGRKVVIK